MIAGGGTDVVRVVVAGQLPQEAHNAPLHLFSASPELVGFGRGAYQQRSEKMSRLMGQLFEAYEGDSVMAFTWDDFEHLYIKDHFRQLTPEEQRAALERLSPERRRALLQSLPPEFLREVVKSLPAEEHRQVLESLSPEERREVLQLLPAQERLEGLSPEQIRQYLERLTGGGRPAEPRKPRRKR